VNDSTITKLEATEDHIIEELEEEHQTKPGFYVFIAAILFGLTALEVWLYYLEKDNAITSGPLTIMLIILAAVKFILVAGWFMHLKDDTNIYALWFAIGGVVAFVVFFCTLLSLQVFTPLAQS
jgi:cytochrome c oxidase subunit 4